MIGETVCRWELRVAAPANSFCSIVLLLFRCFAKLGIVEPLFTRKLRLQMTFEHGGPAWQMALLQDVAA